MNLVSAERSGRPPVKVESVERPSIAIVSHAAYGAFTGGARGHVGGVEWQTSLTARWLAARGYRVSLLTWDEGQGEESTIDGVRLIPICRRRAGLPGVRFLHPRWTGLLRALRRADADVYYHNCAEYVTGQIGLWCRAHGRGFVFSAASNMDCDALLPEMRSMRERVLYRAGLRRADRVIVQTSMQRGMLRDGFRVESQVIGMPCPGPAAEAFRPPQLPSPATARVLWIGRLIPLKRLEWLLEIAGRMPTVAFDVIAPPDTASYGAAMEAAAATVPNLTWHGRVERGKMPEFYARAALLCCTSTIEGFPNTFLEAWSHGVPVVTTFDPDGLVARRRLGGVASDPAALTAAMERLLGEGELWQAASRAGRAYWEQHHAPEIVLPQFEQVFVEVGQAAAARRAGGR